MLLFFSLVDLKKINIVGYNLYTKVNIDGSYKEHGSSKFVNPYIDQSKPHKIEFDLKFNMMYYTGVQAARNQKQLASVLGGALGLGPKERDAVTTTGANPSFGIVGNAAGGETNDDTSSTDNEQGANGGNAAGDDSETGTARYFNDMMINSGNDLIQVDLKIHGDPYFISDVGVGNFLGLPSSPLLPVTIDGSMNPMDGEVYVILNFRTPIDYDDTSGGMIFPRRGTEPVGQFSGLYKVLTVQNNFSGGKFTQVLSLLRRKKQEDANIAGVSGDENKAVVSGPEGNVDKNVVPPASNSDNTEAPPPASGNQQ